jgi:hypothetical protein
MHVSNSYSHLQGWTPISFSPGSEPVITWADLRSYRFDAPFFGYTVAQWRRDTAGRTETTGPAALQALDATPSLDPCLIIAHSARCGSTWLAGMMRAMEGALTVVEPSCISELLANGLCHPSAHAGDEILRQTVRALGRIRHGDERRYVLKLSSTLTRFLPQFRRAFPGTPMVWLQRRPSEIVESLLRAPSAWIKSNAEGGNGLDQPILSKTTLVFLAASSLVNDGMLVLDYRDLPEAAWTQVAPFIGVALNRREIARMQDIASQDSKSGGPFVPRPLRQLPAPVQAAIHQAIDPLYKALDRRRRRAAV